MKQAVKTSLGLGLLLLATACDGGGATTSGSAMLEDNKSVTREITAILATMHDEASAEAASAELKVLTDRVLELRKREKALSPDQYLVMNGGDEELKGLRRELMRELMRLSTDKALAPYIEDAYANLDR